MIARRPGCAGSSRGALGSGSLVWWACWGALRPRARGGGARGARRGSGRAGVRDDGLSVAGERGATARSPGAGAGRRRGGGPGAANPRCRHHSRRSALDSLPGDGGRHRGGGGPVRAQRRAVVAPGGRDPRGGRANHCPGRRRVAGQRESGASPAPGRARRRGPHRRRIGTAARRDRDAGRDGAVVTDSRESRIGDAPRGGRARTDGARAGHAHTAPHRPTPTPPAPAPVSGAATRVREGQRGLRAARRAPAEPGSTRARG